MVYIAGIPACTWWQLRRADGQVHLQTGAGGAYIQEVYPPRGTREAYMEVFTHLGGVPERHNREIYPPRRGPREA